MGLFQQEPRRDNCFFVSFKTHSLLSGCVLFIDMKFLKKNWLNILVLLFIALLFLPQTGMPIRVYFNRLVAFSPSEVEKSERIILNDYNWALNTLDEELVNLTQSEGKVVLINKWATWCPPCVAELPSLQELHTAYGDQVDFYLVTAEKEEIVNRFLKKKGYNFPVYIQSEKSPELLFSRSIPQTFVLSKNGEIVIDKGGVANWNSEKIHKLLDELLAKN